jgi:hypothetical protein
LAEEEEKRIATIAVKPRTFIPSRNDEFEVVIVLGKTDNIQRKIRLWINYSLKIHT